MRRKLRLLGFTIIVATLMLLVADFLKHSADVGGGAAKAKKIPAGFISNLTGTGEVETAFAGRVTMIAEEMSASKDGSRSSALRYRVEGDDPTPSNEGMTLSTSVIVSGDSDDSSKAAFRVDAPECWLPIDKSSPTLRFDFEQEWHLSKPIFSIRHFGDAGALTIKATLALLDPQSNLIVTKDFFTLDSGDLHLEGGSLTLNPETSRIEFTPYNGSLRWSIRNDDGQIITGDSDGPGSFVALENGDYLLTLGSKTSVRAQFPEGASIVGDIETPRLELRLSPGDDGHWRPRIARLEQPTLWHGRVLQLRGAESIISWLSDGALNDFIVSGPINIIPNNSTFLKASARESAQLFANENIVHLTGDVTVHRLDGSVKGDLAILSDESMVMKGAVSIIGEQAIATANEFSTDAANNWQLDGEAYLEPDNESISWLAADHLSVDSAGVIKGVGNFSAELQIGGSPAKLACDQFTSLPGRRFRSSTGAERDNMAKGNIILESNNGIVFGHRLDQLDDDRYLILAGENDLAHGFVRGQDREVSFRASNVLYSPEQVALSGGPSINVPVDGYGLAGLSTTLMAGKIVYSTSSQQWLATKDVVMAGAITGSCQQLVLNTDSVILTGGRSDETSLCKISTALEDRSRIDLEGDIIEFVFGDSLTISDNVFVQRVSDTTDWLRCDSFEATTAGGKADRQVRALIKQSKIDCHSISWLRDNNGEIFVLNGAPLLNHPQAIVGGKRIEFCPTLSTITAYGDEKTLATIKRADGQSAVGSWIKYNYDNHDLDARSAIFEDSP
jgi:hypothetical protein